MDLVPLRCFLSVVYVIFFSLTTIFDCILPFYFSIAGDLLERVRVF